MYISIGAFRKLNTWLCFYLGVVEIFYHATVLLHVLVVLIPCLISYWTRPYKPRAQPPII